MLKNLQIFALAMAGGLVLAQSAPAAGIDPASVEFQTPGQIKWVRNAAGTNEQAVLFGDPNKPGPYVVRIKWLPGNMSRPHFHPNDRFFFCHLRDLVGGDRRNLKIPSLSLPAVM